MTSIMILLFIFVVLFSVILGFIFGASLKRLPVSGDLIARQDEDGIYLFLELTDKPEDILAKNHVVFKVRKNDNSSNDK